MHVDEELIKKIARVARLDLTKEEIKKFTPELAEILKAFTVLKEVDTKNIEPAFHPIENADAMREDTPGDCLSQEQALSLTKHKKDGYFKGPKAIEK